MEIGWIDFSRKERNKVLNVLASLGEKGTLDELGISPIRDGFAELFFPGTSTLQTKAKYFLLIPYACRTVELSDISTPEKAEEIKADNAARQEWNRTADMALLSGISEAKIIAVKQTEIHEKVSQSI